MEGGRGGYMNKRHCNPTQNSWCTRLDIKRDVPPSPPPHLPSDQAYTDYYTARLDATRRVETIFAVSLPRSAATHIRYRTQKSPRPRRAAFDAEKTHRRVVPLDAVHIIILRQRYLVVRGEGCGVSHHPGGIQHHHAACDTSSRIMRRGGVLAPPRAAAARIIIRKARHECWLCYIMLLCLVSRIGVIDFSNFLSIIDLSESLILLSASCR